MVDKFCELKTQPLVSIIAIAVCVAMTATLGVPDRATADDGLDRLLKKAKLSEQQKAAETAPKPDVACVIPNTIKDSRLVMPAGYAQEFSFTDPTGFSARGEMTAAPSDVLPAPLVFGSEIYDPERQPINRWHPNSKRDEYVYDGDDRGRPVTVDQSWNVYGLDTQDTIGHFDTLDGRRLVTPSNRVAIYAPRFGAVRKVNGLYNAQRNTYVGAMEEKTMLAKSAASDFSSTTKQHVAVDRFDGRNRASGLKNRTRGVLSDSVTHLFGMRNSFQGYENLSLIRIGKMENSETARLSAGIQAAKVWEDDLGLQVTTQNVEPVIVNDVAKVQQLLTIESDDKAAILRVTKVASKIAAQPGEFVDFTIRFDNLTGRRIGNVTIIDNLVRRLEYVKDSAECSLNSDFIAKINESDSLMLRWEIVDPVPANSGGIIRFRCRVR